MLVAFESKRFKVLPTVDRKISARFEKEVRDFRGRTGAGGDVVIDARERPDDDILLAAASAAWLGVRPPDPPICFSVGYIALPRPWPNVRI